MGGGIGFSFLGGGIGFSFLGGGGGFSFFGGGGGFSFFGGGGGFSFLGGGGGFSFLGGGNGFSFLIGTGFGASTGYGLLSIFFIDGPLSYIIKVYWSFKVGNLSKSLFFTFTLASVCYVPDSISSPSSARSYYLSLF